MQLPEKSNGYRVSGNCYAGTVPAVLSPLHLLRIAVSQAAKAVFF